MSSRCKACDVILFEEELKTIDPFTGQYIELCFNCLSIALDPEKADDEYHTTKNYYEE